MLHSRHRAARPHALLLGTLALVATINPESWWARFDPQLEAQLVQNLETERKGERFNLIEPPLQPTHRSSAKRWTMPGGPVRSSRHRPARCRRDTSSSSRTCST